MGLEETLTIVVRKADELRAAGVLEIECEGVRLLLAPREAPAAPTVTDDDDDALDPADDGATYGGVVPQRRVKEHSDDDR